MAQLHLTAIMNMMPLRSLYNASLHFDHAFCTRDSRVRIFSQTKTVRAFQPFLSSYVMSILEVGEILELSATLPLLCSFFLSACFSRRVMFSGGTKGGGGAWGGIAPPPMIISCSFVLKITVNHFMMFSYHDEHDICNTASTNRKTDLRAIS